MLVGRDAERAKILALVEAVRRGEGGSLVLVGEPGAGKTALLEWAVDQVDGVRSLAVSNSENEADLPYACLTRLLRGAGDIAERLEADHARPLREVAAGDRFGLGLALLWLLSDLAVERPLVVVVDDVQWVDADSLAVLSFAMRRLEHDPVVFLMAALEPVDDLPWVPVGGLDGVAAGALVERECGMRPSPEALEELLVRTGGNPFALREVAAGLSRRQVAGLDPLPETLPPPRSARRLLERALPGVAARKCAGALALAEGLDVGLVKRALGCELDAVEDAGIVELGGGVVRFAHPLLRWAAEAGLTASERRRAHGILADVLTDVPYLAAERARHRSASVVGYDSEVAEELAGQAAGVLVARGYAASAAVLRKAAGLTPPGERRARLLYDAAELARRSGRGDLAADLFGEARVQAVEPGTRAVIAAGLGQAQLFSGRPREAMGTLAGAAGAADAAVAARARADAAIAAFLAGRTLEAVGLAQDALEVDDGSSALVGPLCEVILGTALLHLGRVPEAAGKLGEASRLVLGAEVDCAGYVAFGALALLWTGDAVGAERIVDPLVAELRGLRALGVLSFALFAAAHVDLYVGRLDVGYAKAVEGAELARATGDHLWQYMAVGAVALAEALRGRPEECRRQVAEAAAMSARFELSYPRDTSDALGLLAMADGDHETAVAHLTRANRPDSAEATPVLGRPTSPDLVEAAVRAGGGLPAGVWEEVAAQTAGDAVHGLAADAWRCRGLLEGEARDSVAAFRTSIELYDGLRLPLRAARARLCLGERLRRAGQPRRARVELRAARDRFVELGAVPWAERAARELRATGDVSTRKRPTGERLTAQETAVAHLVAGGATNKEVAAEMFLSPKTIEMHLSNVYRKLGVRSRTELASRRGER